MAINKIKVGNEEHELQTTVSNITDLKATATELNYVKGVTANIQTQLDAKTQVQTDFYQNDPTAPDYIKNRTHWAEAPITTTEVTLEETTCEGFDEYGSYMHPAVLNLVDGAECTVTWDGVEYVSTCQLDKADGFEMFWIGNPVLCYMPGEDNGVPFGIMTVPAYGMSQFASSDTTITSHTVKIVSTWTTQEIHKLDNKYIDAEWMAKAPVGYERVEFLPEITLSESNDFGGGFGYGFGPIDGFLANGHQTARITLDGVEYASNITGEVYQSEDGDGSIICGNILGVMTGLWGDGDPYVVQIFPAYLALVTPTDGEHTLKIEFDKPIYEQLPAHYIADALASVKPNLAFDEVPTADSTNLVTSASVYNALSAKQDILTFDNDPTEGSTNPVTSSGLFSEFQAHQEQIDNVYLSAICDMPGSLTWDGIVGDKPFVVVEEGQESEGVYYKAGFVHVSDEYPSILRTATTDSPIEVHAGAIVGEEVIGQLIPAVAEADGLVGLGDSILIVPTDGYSTEGAITFPKKGVYFMYCQYDIAGFGTMSPMRATSLNIPGYSFASTGGDASKYFEKTSGVGDTLTWDGNTDGLESVIYSQDGSSLSLGCYRISNSVLTVDDVANGVTVTFLNLQTGGYETQTVSAEETQGMFNEDGTANLGPFLNVPVDGCTLDGITFPKAGIYCAAIIDLATGEVIPMATSLTIPGYNFMIDSPAEVIKTEHLPQALRFGEITTTTYGDTLTWDGNTDGLVNVNGAMYKVSDTIPTLNDIHQGLSVTFSAIDGSEGEPISISAEEAASISMGDDGSIVIEVVCILTRPITGTANDGTMITLPAGVYFYKTEGSYISSFTINNYKGFPTTGTELVKIDKKYLPDDIGGGSGLPEVTIDDNGKTVSVVEGEWQVKQLSYNDLSDKPTPFSGSYNDLSDKPTLGALASKNSLSASDVGLGNVENKSSATIRSEITKDNVTTALGYTPLAPGAQHISNKSSGTYYYKLGTMVADNSGNYGNITISGRLGGWEQSNSANFDIMMLNRSSARDGNTITATVSASGEVEQALTKCDIVVYKQNDTSAIVYLKLSGYWLYDFDWNVYQHSISYNATNVTPTGTLVWSLSTTPKTILDTSGKFYINGNQAATVSDVNSAIEAAIGAAIAASY